MPQANNVGHAEPPPFPESRRLRTDDWPEPSRASIFREQFGRDRVLVEPLPGHALAIDVTLAKFPGLGLVWGRRSPLRSEFVDGSDRLLFSLGSPAVARQFGREIELAAGDAIALSGADPGAFITLAPGSIVTLEFPNGSLARSLNDPRKTCLARIGKNEPGLRLLRTYLRSFLAIGASAPSPLRSAATRHVLDLATLVLGASPQAAEIARLGGVPAAHLRAIKDDILARLETDISIGDIAARHSLSPRYIRLLFERDQTTFTEFVRDERLDRARRRLLNSRTERFRISDIAYSVGFNDVSYFNRAFRRRFGRSPREIRESAVG
jgi:AraC-like DNA-binding protein